MSKRISGFTKSVLGFSIFQFIVVIIGLRIPYIYFVWLLVCAGLSFNKESKFQFAMLFCSIPYTMVMKLTPSSISFYTFLMLMIALFQLIKGHLIKRKFVIALMIFITVSFWGISGASTDWIKMIMGFFLLYKFCQQNNSNDLVGYVSGYSIGLLGASLIGLEKTNNVLIGKYFSDLNSEYINGATIYRFSALYEDPNYFSISVVIAVFIILLLTVYKRVNKVAGIIMGLILIAFGSISYSKMFFVAIVACLAVLALVKIRKTKYFFPKLIGFGLIAVGLVYFMQRSSYYSGIMGRFQKNDFSNGRFQLLNMYITYIFSSVKTMIIGEGIGAGFVGTHGPHNTYVELLYHFGIVGSVSYLWALFCSLKTSNTVRVRKVESLTLIAVFMFMIGTLGVLKMNDMILYYMIIYATCDFIDNVDRELKV